ncbi:MAG: PEP-CTERM system TPR-repeat protein PrsT, partial [Gammaproteobacteria bacterium]|nr:PEP-CTERM system TPR-repeat protein PrsT [Gammaproteobacteria bacterium]
MKVKTILIIALSMLAISCGSQLSTEEYITSGKNYVAKENWNSAIIEYKNAIKQSTENPEARWLLAQVYLKVFNSHGALKELNKAVDFGYSKQKLMLDFARAYKQLGQDDEILAEISLSGITDNEIKASLLALRSEAYLRKLDSKNARSELDKAIATDDQNTDVRLAASKYEGSKRNYKKQREWLQPLLEDGRAVADAWSELAILEQREGNLDKAEEYFSKSIAIRKIVHIDHMKRAFVRISQTKYKLATADINTLKKAGFTWPMIGHGEGLIAYEIKQYDQAKTLFEQVLSDFPAYTPSQLFLGLTQYNKGSYQSAIKTLEPYLASHPKVLQARMVYAISLVEVGRLKEGTQKLELLNNDTPGNARIMSLLGSAYLSNKETEKGIGLLRKVALIEKNAAAHLQLGIALISSGRKDFFEEGKQELKTAGKLGPELTEVDSALFRVHMSEKDYDSARKVAKKITTTQNDSPLGNNLEALTYLAERDEEKATSKLQETLKQFPADTLTSNNLARIYLGQNNLQGAKELYQAVLKKVPGDLTSLNQMALISAKEGKADDVISWLSEAVEKNPDEFSPKLRLANQYLRQGSGREALNVLQNVKQERKQLPSYLLVQAKAKMAVKEYDHAVKTLKSLLFKQPKAASAHFMLAQIYGLQKEPAKMRRSLE